MSEVRERTPYYRVFQSTSEIEMDYISAWIEDDKDEDVISLLMSNSQSLWAGCPFDRTCVLLTPQTARDLAAHLISLADKLEGKADVD